MPRIELKDIKRVKKRLASGQEIEYHSIQHQPKSTFWRSDSEVRLYSAEYVDAYQKAHGYTGAEQLPRDRRPIIRTLIVDFYASEAFRTLAERTRKDYQRGLADVDAKWGEAPQCAVSEPDFKDKVLTWVEANWRGKEADYRLTPFKRVLSWASKERGRLASNPLHGIPTYYKSAEGRRAEITCLPDELELVLAAAYPELARAIALESETGLRPGDLVRLSRSHIQATPRGGRAIVLRTNKSRRERPVQIPVTPIAGRIIDTTPPGDMLILKPKQAPRWTERHLSNEFHRLLTDLGLKQGLDGRLAEVGGGDGLHLYDLRGTAVTKLVRAGLTIDELALHMGWKPSYAAKMLDIYLALDTTRADAMLDRIASILVAATPPEPVPALPVPTTGGGKP